MIDHKNKIIFIHIPKCAGSSVEYFFDVKPFDWERPNYTKLTGWCDKRKIHLHHATPKELLETELIDETTWHSYKKFTIVRNPWSRAYSDFIWLNRFNIFNCSFKDFLLKKGKLSQILTNREEKTYRGDHLYPQVDFLKIDGKLVIDTIIRFENLNEDFQRFLEFNNITKRKLPHDKKSKRLFKHYSHFYYDDEIDLVKNLYKGDIEYLNYSFEDKRKQLGDLQNKLKKLKKKIV